MALYPPGPTDRLWGMRLMSQMKADVLGTYVALQRAYGDAVSFRTGPYRLYMFFHPDQVREVLVTNAKSLIRLPRVMKTFAQWNGSSILIAEGEAWARQRRAVQPSFQPRCMENYGRIMTACAHDLIGRWAPAIERQGYIDVDVDQEMTDLTLAIICRAMFDADVAERASEIAQAVAVLSRVAFNEMQAPLRWPAWIPLPQNRRKRKAIETLDEVVWKFIKDDQDSSGRGFISSMLRSQHTEPGAPTLRPRQVRDEAMTLMLAGHDTTAAAFDWLWYCLAKHPDIAHRCQKEIDHVIGLRDPVIGDIPRLPTLTATIRETLRLYPPAFAIFLRQATENLSIGAFSVPKGSLITTSPFVTHRDSRWFENPERFDPDRFLPPRDEAIPSHAYFPFGAGPRACIGQSFAMAELTIVAATLLQRFDVCMAPSEPEPQLQVTMALRPKHPLRLRWTARAGVATVSSAEVNGQSNTGLTCRKLANLLPLLRRRTRLDYG